MTGSPPRDSVISLIINVILLIHIKAPDLHMVRALDENLKRRMKPYFFFFLSFFSRSVWVFGNTTVYVARSYRGAVFHMVSIYGKSEEGGSSLRSLILV